MDFNRIAQRIANTTVAAKVEEQDCENCDGEGFVEWTEDTTDYAYEHTTVEHVEECRVCRGSGKVEIEIEEEEVEEEVEE